MLKSINPYDQTLLAEFEYFDATTISRTIDQAFTAFQSWKAASFSVRAEKLRQAALLLRQNRESYARNISTEMGKPIVEARSEVDKCADVCDYYANNGERFLTDQFVQTNATKSFVAFEPLGPVLAIMPWNFPLWQVFRFAAPALMAGNVALLKHASNVTQCSLMIAEIFNEAGFPENVFQSLLVSSKDVEKIIAHDHIRAVTLTGSEEAGSQVASLAGKYLKKSVLELGGSDAFIVLEDADLALAAKVGCDSRMRNAGQSCIAAKRFIVLKQVKNDFLDHFLHHIKMLVPGDPLNEKTTLGPMARMDLAEEVERQVKQCKKEGAVLVQGGQRSGCRFEPTVLDNVRPQMTAFKEEIFGPVASIITVDDEQEAILLANQSRYGLGGSVWTGDLERGESVARRMETGSVFVNSLMRSDQRLPFGGIKKSGFGRELSEFGIREFVNIKSLFLNSNPINSRRKGE